MQCGLNVKRSVIPSESLRVWSKVRLRIILFSSVGGPLHCILCVTSRTNSINETKVRMSPIPRKLCTVLVRQCSY